MKNLTEKIRKTLIIASTAIAFGAAGKGIYDIRECEWYLNNAYLKTEYFEEYREYENKAMLEGLVSMAAMIPLAWYTHSLKKKRKKKSKLI